MDRRRKTAFLLALLIFSVQAVSVFGNGVDRHPDNSYIALGADLTDAERGIVLSYFGLDESDLASYSVISVTNQEEHQYLDDYLDRGVIGGRALSSVIVTIREAGYGIHVTTQNISYCTVGMYQNALATAGIKDADILVAGPFSISGTAALIGAIKSYEGLTGQTMDSAQVDAANRELAVSSELGKVLDNPSQAEQLVSIVKDQVVSNDYNLEEIGEIIDQTASEMQIPLTEADRQKILELMGQVSDLELNIEDLKQQVSNIYEQLQSVGLNVEKEQAKGFLNRLWEKLENFMYGLVGQQ